MEIRIHIHSEIQETTVDEAARRCIAAFDNCFRLSASDRRAMSFLEDEGKRFSRWASRMNVLDSGSSYLDNRGRCMNVFDFGRRHPENRLREALDVVRVTVWLLEALEHRLKRRFSLARPSTKAEPEIVSELESFDEPNFITSSNPRSAIPDVAEVIDFLHRLTDIIQKVAEDAQSLTAVKPSPLENEKRNDPEKALKDSFRSLLQDIQYPNLDEALLDRLSVAMLGRRDAKEDLPKASLDKAYNLSSRPRHQHIDEGNLLKSTLVKSGKSGHRASSGRHKRAEKQSKSAAVAFEKPQSKNWFHLEPDGFPCLLAPYGCRSKFSSKGELKRHTSTQHIKLEFWRCDLCGLIEDNFDHTLNYNDFTRKDLFTQHLRRMHGTPLVASPRVKEFHPVTEHNIAEHQQRCWQKLRDTPPRSSCLFCERSFEGAGSWEERMEHIGQHLEEEMGDKSEQNFGDISKWKSDKELEVWLLNEGIIAVGDEKQWEIGDGKPRRLMLASENKESLVILAAHVYQTELSSRQSIRLRKSVRHNSIYGQSGYSDVSYLR